MTYVPNMIQIPTHVGDLEHRKFHMEERRHKSPIKPLQGKREWEKKEGSRKKGRCPFINTC
jgi:hypothetical protein